MRKRECASNPLVLLLLVLLHILPMTMVSFLEQMFGMVNVLRESLSSLISFDNWELKLLHY